MMLSSTVMPRNSAMFWKGNLLQEAVKNAIVMVHDIDLPLVSQTPRNVQNTVKSMSCTMSTKMNRTAVDRGPGRHGQRVDGSA